jgi:phosphopantetheinyl transferase
MPVDQHLRDGVVVHVQLEASDDDQRELAQLLSVDEQNRANRFVTQELRKRFIVGRARLRMVLGRLVGKRPDAIRFRYNQFGKPFLEDPSEQSLAFNLSHSANYALIAVRQNSVVGIDTEFSDPKIQATSLATQIFLPEELYRWERVRNEDSRRSLLLAWVIKESVLKAIGIGLSDGMASIPLPDDFFLDFNKRIFAISPGQITSAVATKNKAMNAMDENDTLSFQIRILDLNPQFFSALCCDRDPASFACMSWESFQDRFSAN